MNILLICIYQFSSDGVSVCSDPDPHFKNQLHAQSHAYIELISRGFVFIKKRHHVLDSTLHLFGGSLSVTQLDLF